MNIIPYSCGKEAANLEYVFILKNEAKEYMYVPI